jgi:hypothetical protein
MHPCAEGRVALGSHNRRDYEKQTYLTHSQELGAILCGTVKQTLIAVGVSQLGTDTLGEPLFGL